jgi:hypothetical protein
MKPIREYLAELPAPYNTLALSVVDENFESYKAQVDSLYRAILFMCNWDNTPQGWHFWNNVNLWCLDPNNRQLPPIPAVEVEKPKQNINAANIFVGGVYPKNNKPQVEKPKYLKHKTGGFIFEVTSQEGDIFEGVIVECNQYSMVHAKGEKRTDLNVKYFEPCDYTPPIKKQENMTISTIDQQLGEQPVKPSITVPHFESHDNTLPDQSQILGFEVSPEVEQPNKTNELFTLIEQVRKKLIDLEQENTELKAQLAELLSNPKKLVYDAKWLNKIVCNYNANYGFDDGVVYVRGSYGNNEVLNQISPKDSAPIIMAALAKELNPLYEVHDERRYGIHQHKGGYAIEWSSIGNTNATEIFTSETSAQKAIDILTKIAPQVLKNYFA